MKTVIYTYTSSSPREGLAPLLIVRTILKLCAAVCREGEGDFLEQVIASSGPLGFAVLWKHETYRCFALVMLAALVGEDMRVHPGFAIDLAENEALNTVARIIMVITLWRVVMWCKNNNGASDWTVIGTSRNPSKITNYKIPTALRLFKLNLYSCSPYAIHLR